MSDTLSRMLKPITDRLDRLETRLSLFPRVWDATVTSAGPIRLQRDDEGSPIESSPETLVQVGGGDRVRVLHWLTRYLILGRVNTAGVPYRMQVGSVNVTTSTAGTPVDAVINFAAGRFTVAPRVFPSALTGQEFDSISFMNTSPSQVTVRVRRQATGTITVVWHAIQMTPTSAEG